MKTTLLFCLLLLTSSAFANQYGYLEAKDQKYFKNDSFEGNNQRERVDMNVKEINKLHGEVDALKGEINNLKREIEELKKKK